MNKTFSEKQLLNLLNQSDKRWLAMDVDSLNEEQKENFEGYIEGARIRQELRDAADQSGKWWDDDPAGGGEGSDAPDDTETQRPRGLKRLKGAAMNLATNVMFNRFTSKATAEEKKTWSPRKRVVAAALGIASLAAGAYFIRKEVIDHDSAARISELNAASIGGDIGDTLKDQAQEQIKAMAATPDEAMLDTAEQVGSAAATAAAAAATEAKDSAASAAQEAVQAWTDTVGSGEGITHTFGDYLDTQGVNATPEQLFEAFNKANAAGMISPENISGISPQDVQGGYGFNGAGQTQLSPEIIEFLNKEFGIS